VVKVSVVMIKELWRLTEFVSGETYHFCSEMCADIYKEENDGDFDDPEELLSQSDLAEAIDERWRCDQCDTIMGR
jgi:hypothetical protein